MCACVCVSDSGAYVCVCDVCVVYVCFSNSDSRCRVSVCIPISGDFIFPCHTYNLDYIYIDNITYYMLPIFSITLSH